ncbi:flagellar protein FlgN [Bacillus sp. V59.32b]|uniref:flagellar protein FlgN n=1 Tax=Bacillus sp. V59.32b TaxID=1758642 RepID=UPI000E3BEB3E|nr:flagellar protein FlgN [Bacillus sp. V59.32b]RFU67418.1 flagellar protein FlgN [Bacillus sp. V59.32b]
MSAEHIQASLEKLVELHRSLNELATKKTEIIKQGDTEALNQLLMDEQKHIKAIEATEKERQTAVAAFLEIEGQEAEPSTITRVLELLSPNDEEALNRLKEELILEAETLKEQNYLNQQLVYQSLQFVNVTLDMLLPQNKQFNYDKPAKPKQQGSNSMFDSRA